MNRERLIAVVYATAVLTLGLVHSEFLMIGAIVTTLLLGGAVRWRILKRTFLVVALFAGSVSLGYLLFSFFMPVRLDALWLINLRTFAITQLTFTLVLHVNLHRLFGSRSMLGMLYALTYAQIMMLQKLLESYLQGVKSRGSSLRGITKTVGLLPLLELLFGAMFKRSDEQVMGLRSRGLIDD